HRSLHPFPTRRSSDLVAAAILFATVIAIFASQVPPVRDIDENTLRQYEGVYQWAPDAFLYLQIWNELAGKNQLVAFDESGDVRTDRKSTRLNSSHVKI